MPSAGLRASSGSLAASMLAVRVSRMRTIARNFSYANVMATIAVFIALGGSATATGVFAPAGATHRSRAGSASVKKGKAKKPKARPGPPARQARSAPQDRSAPQE